MRTLRLKLTLPMLLFLLTAAWATPIQPDLKKLLSEPHKAEHFPAARAGWNGPEAVPASQANPSPAMERFGPQAYARSIRKELRDVFTPDWRALIGLAGVIFLLRCLRSRNERELQPEYQRVDSEPTRRLPAA